MGERFLGRLEELDHEFIKPFNVSADQQTTCKPEWLGGAHRDWD